MINLLHLNGHDVHGGAERICGQLIERQLAAGHFSTLLTGHKTRLQSTAIPLPRRAKIELAAAADFPDYDIDGSFELLTHPLVEAADVLHLHNAYGGWLNPWVMPALSHLRPLVWTLHDMQSLAGYCSHPLACVRWESGCGQCPDLNLPGPKLTRDITAELWRDKALISSLSRLHLVACCEWARANLSRSLLARHPVEVIPNGVDTTVFQPRDRAEARKRLGLSAGALVLGGVASSGPLSHPWKGGPDTLKALEMLAGRGVEPLFLDVGSRGDSTHPRVRAIPFVESEEEMSWIYAAMDIFLFPSLAENMPLGTLEAMACGLPVVATRVGGIPEQITTGVNGLLVPANDAASLAESLNLLANDPAIRKRLGAAARERAVCEFDIAKCAARYESLYGRLAGEGRKEPTEPGPLWQWVAAERKTFEAAAKVKELQRKRKADQARTAETASLLRGQNWLHTLVRLKLAPRDFRRWWEKQHRG